MEAATEEPPKAGTMKGFFTKMERKPVRLCCWLRTLVVRSLTLSCQAGAPAVKEAPPAAGKAGFFTKQAPKPGAVDAAKKSGVLTQSTPQDSANNDDDDDDEEEEEEEPVVASKARLDCHGLGEECVCV